MIKKLTFWLFALSFIFSLIQYFVFDLTTATGSFLMVAILTLNVIVLSLIGRLLIKQKSSGLVAVLGFMKYPVVILLIYLLFKYSLISSLGVVLGICEFVLIIVLVVIFRKRDKTNDL